MEPAIFNKQPLPNPLIFQFEVWAKSRGSLSQGQHSVNQVPAFLLSSRWWHGRRGGGKRLLYICVTQREMLKSGTVHIITWRFEHEGLMNTNCSIIFVKREWEKLSKLLRISNSLRCKQRYSSLNSS